MSSVLVVGSSTGGPEALRRFLGQLRADHPQPVLVAQHMPAGFTRGLAERLDSLLRIEVREAQAGDPLRSGRVLLAPGGRQLEIASGGRLVSTPIGPPGPRPRIDRLFVSAARAYGSGVTAVVLTGMGEDGLEGARAVHLAGGRVLVQDEASSVVWGMPGVVARAGLAQAEDSPEGLGRRVAIAR